MATQSYSSLQKEIAKLQQEAEMIRSTEVAGVVAKIKEAIATYSLEPSDLFSKGALMGKASTATKSKSKTGAAVAYADGKGGTWVGRGPRPLWLREAIASGHSLSDYAVGVGARSSGAGAETAPTAPATASKKAAKKVAAKKGSKKRGYKNPNGSETWSGFGRQPGWLQKAIAAGQTMESMLM